MTEIERETALKVFERLAAAWDDVSATTKAVECALPRQMSEAMVRMIEARAKMDAVVREIGLNIARTRPEPPLHGYAEGIADAAKVAETLFAEPGWNGHYVGAASKIAAAIRALAPKEPQP